MIDTLVLAGLSGTGKSTVGREVASLLGWTAIDTDDNIQTSTAMSIPEIFEREGEPGFRAHERSELTRALDQRRVVIATGGGAVIAEDTWKDDMLRRPGVLTVTLDAPAEVVLARLAEASAKYGDAVKRPLLDAVDTLQKIRTMKVDRAPAYARSDVMLPVDGRSIADVAADLTELVTLANGGPSSVPLTLPASQSTIEVGNGSRHQLAIVIRSSWPRAQHVWL
ncbi:MAG: shikimate kinase, partial [Thermomicrobiales bacterium]